MKRLPDLLKKTKPNRLPAGASTIGIMGTGPGTGVTHTCIMLANMIGGMKGKRTALLEMNQSQDFFHIQKAYEGEENAAGKEHFFNIFQISYYCEVQKQEVISILNLNYECFIFDFGSSRKENIGEFLRCTEKVVVCSLSEWKIHELVSFLNEVKTVAGYQDWKYIAVLGDKSSAKDLERELGISILCMETDENPFALSKSTLSMLQNMF